jgi:hypothetical protein
LTALHRALNGQGKGGNRLLKQVHFRIEQELWEEFKKIFPYKGEPSAFFKRCVIAAITHRGEEVEPSEVIKIVKETDER